MALTSANSDIVCADIRKNNQPLAQVILAQLATIYIAFNPPQNPQNSEAGLAWTPGPHTLRFLKSAPTSKPTPPSDHPKIDEPGGARQNNPPSLQPGPSKIGNNWHQTCAGTKAQARPDLPDNPALLHKTFNFFPNMTYCVAIKLNAGLVFLSDSRTNAGLDQISTFRKMIVYEKPDDRFMVLLSAGNLSISQSVREILQVEKLKDHDEDDGITIWNAKSMFDAARVLGAAIRHVYERDAASLKLAGVDFNVSLIFGGQIKGEGMRLFQV
jgi:hypothetical protein